MEDLEEIRAELIQLLQKQFEYLRLSPFIEPTDAEWLEYDIRDARIRELQARLGQLNAAA